jgi:beta-keto acid cleavage enzyme
MIEPVNANAKAATALVAVIHDGLDRHGLTRAPRLQHGDGEATWVLLADAVERGQDTRIGLEDTLFEPDGSLTAGNATLVQRTRSFMEDP